jgi:serine/threonine protein kinase
LDRIEVCIQVARAVCHLHLNGLAHRNLSPDVIVLDEKDHCFKVLVTKEIEDVKNPSGVLMRGLPGYIAPEQYIGKLNMNLPESLYKIDVFAVGLICGDIIRGHQEERLIEEIKQSPLRFQEPFLPKEPTIMDPYQDRPYFFDFLLRSCWNVNPEMRPDMLRVLKGLEESKQRAIINVEKSREAFHMNDTTECSYKYN